MAKDLVFTFCVYALLCSEFYKECKYIHNLTWTWITVDPCQSPWILPWFMQSHRPWLWIDDLVQPLYKWQCEGGERIIVSCPRVLVAIDHPVTVESAIRWSFSKFFLNCCTLFCEWVDPLGKWCTSVYFAEKSLKVCKSTFSCYLVWTIQPYWWWSSKLATWRD